MTYIYDLYVYMTYIYMTYISRIYDLYIYMTFLYIYIYDLYYPSRSHKFLNYDFSVKCRSMIPCILEPYVHKP